jgi:ribose-phosphate pyrophosphokinase
MGYSLQDKVFRKGEPISAKVIADLVSNSFISRVFLLDLHNPSIPGFFSVPTYHLSTTELFVTYLETQNYLNDTVIVSPDFGGLKKSRQLADQLNLPLLNIEKSRDLVTGKVTAHALYGGQITGKNALIFDDVIVSGGTAVQTAALLKKEGAKRVIFMATHGVFCNNGLELIANSQLDHVIISNSIAQKSKIDKITQLDLAPLFVNALIDWI